MRDLRYLFLTYSLTQLNVYFETSLHFAMKLIKFNFMSLCIYKRFFFV